MRHPLRITASLIVLLLIGACAPAALTPEGEPPTIQPSETVAPTASVRAVATQPPTTAPVAPVATAAGMPARTITLSAPQTGASVSSPVRISGETSITPFEATLLGRVYDAQDRVVGEGPIMVNGEMGQPGSFDGTLDFSVSQSGPGSVEIAEISAKDGSVMVAVWVDVMLQAEGEQSLIEVPSANERVTLPLHILARVGDPGERLTAAVRWADGTELSETFTVLAGEDGQGLLIGNLGWKTESEPPQPADRAAVLQIRAGAGDVLAEQPLDILRWDDPDAQSVDLFFVLQEDVQAISQAVPRTEAIGAAALNALLWGPPPGNLAGFTTAIPTPEEVLEYPGREPDWGPRVRLLDLAIEDGVAVANFSQEMSAYGGGSVRVMLIRRQIAETLQQFPTVSEVVIAIEGETEAVLEP